MTKPKRKTKLPGSPSLRVIDEMRDTFLEQAAELWDAQKDKFCSVVAGGEAWKINLAFAASIDLSDSAPKLETSIRFSQVFSDSREETWPVDVAVAEPGQIVAETILRESLPAKHRRKK